MTKHKTSLSSIPGVTNHDGSGKKKETIANKTHMNGLECATYLFRNFLALAVHLLFAFLLLLGGLLFVLLAERDTSEGPFLFDLFGLFIAVLCGGLAVV